MTYLFAAVPLLFWANANASVMTNSLLLAGIGLLGPGMVRLSVWSRQSLAALCVLRHPWYMSIAAQRNRMMPSR